MTVDNIEVSDTLTIGGAPPLKQDAIDKLQAQIINPYQDIYVDAINGNDNNDGTSWDKAIKTLDNAYVIMKSNVPRITIYLNNDVADTEYSFTKRAFWNKNNTQIRIAPKTLTKERMPIIKPCVCKTLADTHNGYRIGYILIFGFDKVILNYIKIQYPDDAEIIDKYSEQLIWEAQTVQIDGCEINLIDKSVLLQPLAQHLHTANIVQTTINGANNTYLARTNPLLTTIPNGSENNQGNWTTWRSNTHSVIVSLTKNDGTKINNLTSLTYSDCTVLYNNLT